MLKPSGDSRNKRALFLSPESPYPMVGGGALRSASLLEYLIQDYDVDLVVFREPGEADPRDAIPSGKVRNMFVLNLPFHSKLAGARLVRNGLRYLRGAPPLLDRFSGFDTEIDALLHKSSYDLGVIEHFWCAPYARRLRQRCRKLILDLHNIESVWHARLARTSGGASAIVHNRFAKCYSKLEHAWLSQFDELLVTSTPDREIVGTIDGQARVTMYPNALPEIPRPMRAEENAVIFSGNLEYQPNISAIDFFYSDIWPIVQERAAGTRWDIIGKHPEGIASRLGSNSSIHVIGPISDAVQALAQARVAIVPVQAGSGTRFKILEAWAAATPVVSTTIGAEGLSGIPGEHLLIADDAPTFADAVVNLLRSPAERRRIGEAGRLLYEERYTWKAAWRELHF